MSQKERDQNYFTIIELLVVISVISVLITMLIPSLRKARLSGMTAVSINNIKQIHLGSVLYSTDNEEWMCLVANNPTHATPDANWRVPIYEYASGETLPKDNTKDAMENGGYRKLMYCPVILQDRGGYPSPHGEGRGHYGMNYFFGWNLTDKPNTGRGYKSIPFANLENDREPLFMPTKRSGDGQTNSSGHKLAGGDIDGGRSCPEYIYTNNKSFACFLDGHVNFKSPAWGDAMDADFDNENNFK